MLRLLELFSGIGAQRMALDRLGIEYKSVGISEISRPALRAYRQIHGDLDNLGDITRLEALPDCDMLTYSFPCQDLSIAGFRRGMDRGTGTRSGLLWEVERLLKGAGHLPDFLVMENVVQVHSPANAGAWRDWIASLSRLGYTSAWADINAADHGIPQHRVRCIMISRRDGHVWVPPRPRPLRRALRDVLEEGPIDREYYIQPDRMRTLLAHLMRNRDAGRGFGMRASGHGLGIQLHQRYQDTGRPRPRGRTLHTDSRGAKDHRGDTAGVPHQTAHSEGVLALDGSLCPGRPRVL